ncbi:glucose-inhibited division protein A [Thiovulum sp. ES]|nr:glucose-inhibited division protein A [Thiovulum sp. ES]
MVSPTHSIDKCKLDLSKNSGKNLKYDVIVVGGGHAGIEASLVSARLGKKTLLISMLSERVGATSCNPAIGGLAKGHLVKEVDALGGEMGKATDKCGIQFRILNENKGPAVRGSRAQIDMDRYAIHMRTVILDTENLELAQDTVESLIVENGEVLGVKTELQIEYFAKKVILTTGTFLNGVTHIGEIKHNAGRYGEFASVGLAENLKDLGFRVGRLKTGTTARLDASTIDFSVMEVQGGDEVAIPFSFQTDREEFQKKEQLPCYVTYTNEETHQIIEGNFYRTPLFTGQIAGVGPRYCPSIEDKINRFRERDRHHLFVEPQTIEATEYYINGMSTSLPPDVQRDMIHSVRGLENARIVRYGYAIEYDYIDPTELKHSLQTKKIKNLYFAGQINGTTGYEEAAAQGLMAGINASLSIDEKEPLVFRRDESYIGVLIDDLVTKGTIEPYRMFTSRAEYRLLLREDNAHLRLSKYGFDLGLISEDFYSRVEKLDRDIAEKMVELHETFMTPNRESLQFLESIGQDKIKDRTSYQRVIGRKGFTLENLEALLPEWKDLDLELKEQILIECKYYNYIYKQKEQIEKMKTLLETKIPEDFNFRAISGLSSEIIEKLEKFNPPNLQSASQIQGMTPAGLDILQVYLKRK